MLRLILGFLLFSSVTTFAQETPESVKANAANLLESQVTIEVSYVSISSQVKDGENGDLMLFCTDGKGNSSGLFRALALKTALPEILKKYGEKSERKDGKTASKSISGVLRKDRFGSLYLDLTETSL